MKPLETVKDTLAIASQESMSAPKSDDVGHDPALASLFSSSLGPTKTFNNSSSSGNSTKLRKGLLVNGNKANLNDPGESNVTDSTGTQLANPSTRETSVDAPHEYASTRQPNQSRKRKRKDTGDELEEQYMRRLAKEELQETKQHESRKRFTSDVSDDNGVQPHDELVENVDQSTGALQTHQNDEDFEVPKHETEIAHDSELEKSRRTVFLSNVSSEAIKSKTAYKTLMTYLSSFLGDLPTSKPPHRIDSLRFRSVAFESVGIPKKASFATKELKDSTTKATNAYIVYSSEQAARKACQKLNGTVVLDRHIRVDSVAHPAKEDHRRCVFVGNLGFVDDESGIDSAQAAEQGRKPRKRKESADVEEGLWREFGKVGTVENVRVIRDKKTRVGKGIAYVQFKDEHVVEKALLLNEKKFPPLLPRTIRVTRARRVGKKSFAEAKDQQKRGNALRGDLKHGKVVESRNRTVDGRAKNLLGSAGSQKLRKIRHGQVKVKKRSSSSLKRAKEFKSRDKSVAKASKPLSNKDKTK